MRLDGGPKFNLKEFLKQSCMGSEYSDRYRIHPVRLA